MDWQATFDDIYVLRTYREIAFREATSPSANLPDETIPAGVRYRQAGFDPFRGVLYPEDRVELQIWLRDWFSRSEDGATQAELADMIRRLKGDVKEGSKEHYSRFLFDGETFKYASHVWDERPDGILFAAIVTLQAA